MGVQVTPFMYINAPLLTCYVSEKYAEPADWNRLVKAWSILNRLRPADINIVLLTDYLTAGAHYSLRAEINLPTLWPSEGIKQLQKSFLELVQDIVGIPEEDVFIMTQRVESGHVMDRGKLEEW